MTNSPKLPALIVKGVGTVTPPGQSEPKPQPQPEEGK